MAFLQNLGKNNVIEHVSITTTAASAKSGSFSVLTTDGVSDVIIQNLSAAACYVTCGTAQVTATSSHLYLAANASVSFDNVQFTHFSVIRATGTDVTVRITGTGRS